MGVGISDASRELAELQDLMESGDWVPSDPERTIAAVILNSEPRTDASDALVRGVRVAGPDAAQPGADRLARVVVRCAAALRQSPRSDEGLRLVQDLRSLLHLVVALPGKQARRSDI